MYDELIKQLQDFAVELRKAEDALLVNDAANVIEQLSEYVDTIGRLKCEGWHLQQTKFHDGYQAIATMQLPTLPKEG